MEFVCPDPEARVRAANVRATLDAFLLVPSVGERLVMRHQLNIRDLTPENFVPVQRWLDALAEIQAEVGANVVREVGARVVENAGFPPHFDSVEAILEGLDAIYHLNHRGEVGHYRTTRQGETLVVSCETPYPRHFELGLVEGICRNKAARGRSYAIAFEEGRPGSDMTCVVRVSARQRRAA
jgi:hypothetical protein